MWLQAGKYCKLVYDSTKECWQVEILFNKHVSSGLGLKINQCRICKMCLNSVIFQAPFKILVGIGKTVIFFPVIIQKIDKCDFILRRIVKADTAKITINYYLSVNGKSKEKHHIKVYCPIQCYPWNILYEKPRKTFVSQQTRVFINHLVPLPTSGIQDVISTNWTKNINYLALQTCDLQDLYKIEFYFIF